MVSSGESKAWLKTRFDGSAVVVVFGRVVEVLEANARVVVGDTEPDRAQPASTSPATTIAPTSLDLRREGAMLLTSTLFDAEQGRHVALHCHRERPVADR